VSELRSTKGHLEDFIRKLQALVHVSFKKYDELVEWSTLHINEMWESNSDATQPPLEELVKMEGYLTHWIRMFNTSYKNTLFMLIHILL